MSVKGRAAVAAVWLLLMNAGAAALEVTQAADGPVAGGKDFRLSGGMTLSNVSFSEGLGGRVVVLPLDNAGWRAARILDKNFFDKLLAANSGRLSKPASSGQPQIKIVSAFPLYSNFRIARVEVALDGELTVAFGVVRRQKDGLDVYDAVPPQCLGIDEGEFKEQLRRLVVEAGKKAAGAQRQSWFAKI